MFSEPYTASGPGAEGDGVNSMARRDALNGTTTASDSRLPSYARFRARMRAHDVAALRAAPLNEMSR